MIMRRLWFAVLFGIVLGLGMTVVPSSILSEQRANVLMIAPATQPRFEAGTLPNSQFQFIIIGLLAGLAVAVPVFLLAKRRS
jgi:hypothetical protein